MNVELYKDLIKDERGSYYVAVQKEGNELTLVNAMLERSYQDLLEYNEEFKMKYAEYEHQFIGKMIMDKLGTMLYWRPKMMDMGECMI